MAINTANVRAYGDVLQRVYTAPLSAAAPTAPLPAAVPSGYLDLGWLDDTGVVESPNQHQETKKYGWQGAGLVRVLRSQFENPFAFHCLEENAVVLNLMHPGNTTATTGDTAEVQTITITGTGTAGTFDYTAPGVGTISPVYNVSTAALASALSTLYGYAVTVSGSAGSSYVITHAATAGNVPLATVVNHITGATDVSIVTTTPGVNGVNTTGIGPSTSQNLRKFIVDLVDGSVHKRLYFPNGEVVGTGSIAYKADDLTVYEFTLNPYIDSAGKFFYDINDNPALAAGLFV